MAALLPTIKRYMEDNEDGWGAEGKGRRVPLDELKELTEADRADFQKMLADIGIETEWAKAA